MKEKYLYKEYWIKGKSIPEIAQANNTYPNKVRRAMIKYGIQIRDRADAQSTAIKHNRANHPTKGKKMSTETKHKLSRSMSNVWKSLSPEELP